MSLILLAALFLAMCFVVPAPGQVRGHQAVSVLLPPWAAEACQVIGADGDVARRSGRNLTLACPPSTGVIQCASPDVEPADIPLAEVCRTGSIQLYRAQSATVALAAPGEVAIEWLTLSRGGHAQVAPLAIRQFRAQSTLAIPVADVSDRMVRFSRPGASPVSVTASELVRAQWHLPAPKPGGELVGVIQAAKVIPIAYRLAGPQSVFLAANGRAVVSATGLPAGDYEIEPVYPGGLTGSKAAARVDSERSTVLFMAPERVGAANVTTDPDACGQLPELRLVAVTRASSGAVGQTDILRVAGNAQCHWEIGGLLPDTYQVDLIVPTGSAGSSEAFVVFAQEIANVAISPAIVHLSGRVSINDKALANARLEFSSPELGLRPIPAITDPNGRYSVTLARPGRYQVLLEEKSAPIAVKEVEVVSGVNTFDWLTRGGDITVRLKNSRRELPAEVYIESKGTSSREVLAAGDEQVLTKGGLELTTFHISATQGHSLVSAVTTVTLTPSHPTAVVDLEIVESRASLIVSDSSGNPVPRATVRAISPAEPFRPNGGLDIGETDPGVFPLDGLRPGMHLMIAANGLVPTCRVVPLNETVFARLEVGRRIEVQFPRDITTATMPIAALADSAGSDCPVPLAAFRPQMLRAGDAVNDTAVLRIEHFPSAYRFVLIRPGLIRRILVPDNGPVVIDPH